MTPLDRYLMRHGPRASPPLGCDVDRIAADLLREHGAAWCERLARALWRDSRP